MPFTPTVRRNGASVLPVRLTGAYALGFVAFIILMTMLSAVGVPDGVIAPTFLGCMLLTFIGIGFAGRTMQLDEYYVAGRRVAPAYGGIAGGANFISTVSFVSVTASLYLLGYDGLAFVLGFVGGFVIAAIFIAPYVRQAEAYSIPDFLAKRYGGHGVRLLAVVIVLSSSFVFGMAQIYGAAAISAYLLGIDFRLAIYIALACILSSCLFGGMRGVTWVQAAQYLVIVVAFLVPAIWMAFARTGIPVPQLAYAQAMEEIGALEAIQAISSDYLERFSQDGFDVANYVLLVFCLAIGTASLPHVLTRYLATPSPTAARASATWSLVFVAVLLLTAPAYAAFARWAMLDLAASGLTPDNVADKAGWLLRWGAADGSPILVCGKPALDAAAVAASCAGQGIVEIGFNDISLSPGMVVLAAPDMFGMPYVITVLVAAGAIAAALASAQGLLLACANTLGHDLCFQTLDRYAPPSRRLAVTRAVLLLVVGCAALIAAMKPADMLSVALWSFSLAAAGLFPALVLGIWWKGANAAGAVAGMLVSFAICLYYLLGTRYGAVAFYETWSALSSATPEEAANFSSLKTAWVEAGADAKAEAWTALDAYARTIANWWGVRDLSAAAFALPFGFLVTFALSHFTARPGRLVAADEAEPTTAEKTAF